MKKHRYNIDIAYSNHPGEHPILVQVSHLHFQIREFAGESLPALLRAAVETIVREERGQEQ
ncbi:MAG: hypothetical protein MN733_25895 [Nitrososphaera sp.]|nr:hypothetical protein [Nitrososphaera sp.]